MENEIYDILNSYKEAIDLLLNRCDELVKAGAEQAERISKLESVLFDEILEPARLAMEADDTERRLNELLMNTRKFQSHALSLTYTLMDLLKLLKSRLTLLRSL